MLWLVSDQFLPSKCKVAQFMMVDIIRKPLDLVRADLRLSVSRVYMCYTFDCVRNATCSL